MSLSIRDMAPRDRSRPERRITIAQPDGPLKASVLATLTDDDLRVIARELEERHIKPINRRKERQA